MNLAWVIAVAVALGADAFSLSLAIGMTGIKKRLILQLSLVIAVFHVFMPLAGMIIGEAFGSMLGQYASKVGALILMVLGGRMLYKIYRPAPEQYPLSEARDAICHNNLARRVSLGGVGICVLAASVSIDALSVGFSLGTIKADILLTVIVIGLIAGLMTGSGLVLGRVMGTWLGDKAEMFGGLALFLIGIKLFI